jgi:hypothetical protein
MAKLLNVLAFFCLAAVTICIGCAQTQPVSGILTLPSLAADNVARTAPIDEAIPNPVIAQHEKTSKLPTLWKFSLAALAGANAADVASSWGKRELNPALAAPSAKFGAQSAMLKVAIVGVVVGVEYIATRRHPSPGLYKVLSIVNFGDAGIIGGVAVRNFGVPAYSH